MPAKLFHGWLIIQHLAFLHLAILICSNYHTNDGHNLFLDAQHFYENLNDKFMIKQTLNKKDILHNSLISFIILCKDKFWKDILYNSPKVD